MKNVYKTNVLSCKAVQLKDMNDIESFNEDVHKVMDIKIDDYEVSSTPKPILIIQLEDTDMEEPIFMNEGDYFVNIPSFKYPVSMRKETFESMFEKVEDK